MPQPTSTILHNTRQLSSKRELRKCTWSTKATALLLECTIANLSLVTFIPQHSSYLRGIVCGHDGDCEFCARQAGLDPRSVPRQLETSGRLYGLTSLLLGRSHRGLCPAAALLNHRLACGDVRTHLLKQKPQLLFLGFEELPALECLRQTFHVAAKIGARWRKTMGKNGLAQIVCDFEFCQKNLMFAKHLTKRYSTLPPGFSSSARPSSFRANGGWVGDGVVTRSGGCAWCGH